ncbi:unnamed protein product [Peniophora sp. CBMAI 1063]|nr:unnamed protein product [Peniophora sp. CBMAI 1063]
MFLINETSTAGITKDYNTRLEGQSARACPSSLLHPVLSPSPYMRIIQAVKRNPQPTTDISPECWGEGNESRVGEQRNPRPSALRGFGSTTRN